MWSARYHQRMDISVFCRLPKSSKPWHGVNTVPRSCTARTVCLGRNSENETLCQLLFASNWIYGQGDTEGICNNLLQAQLLLLIVSDTYSFHFHADHSSHLGAKAFRSIRCFVQ